MLRFRPGATATILVCLATAPAVWGQAEIKPRRCCWVVAVAMNQEEGFSEDWNQFGEETALLFSSQGKELFEQVETRTVLGQAATHAGIAAAVEWAFSSARTDDLVVVHVSCHGGTTRTDGWSIDTIDGQPAMGRDLKLAAGRVPCPVLFLIDTCESGGFVRPHAQDVDLPANCAALCSSRARQSTTNVLNMAMNEGLWGAADFDADGFIRLAELVRYVEARAKRMALQAGEESPSELPVMMVGENFPEQLPLTRRSADLVAIIHQGAWHLGRRTGDTGDEVGVHVMGYQDNPDKSYFLFNTAKRKQVFDFAPGFVPLMATRNGELRPAILVSRDGSQFTVRFPQNPRQEPVTLDRSEIRLPFPGSRLDTDSD